MENFVQWQSFKRVFVVKEIPPPPFQNTAFVCFLNYRGYLSLLWKVENREIKNKNEYSVISQQFLCPILLLLKLCHDEYFLSYIFLVHL